MKFPIAIRRMPSPTLCLLRAAVALGSFSSAALSGAAQTHKVGATERVTRAVAVYEWTGELDKPKAARLVPVSLFIYGRLQDAGVYLARPTPFALEYGDLYAVEQAGENKGMFSVDHARNVATKSGPAADVTTTAWVGFGKFAPPKPAAKAAALPPSTHLSTIASSADPARPHFGNKPDTSDTSKKPGEASTPGAKTDAADKNSAPASDKNDPDRPQLKRPADKDAEDKKSASDVDGSKAGKDSKADQDSKDNKDSKDDLDRPTLRKRDPADDEKRRKAASKESSVTGPEFSLNEDPDRPTMRRGAAPGAESTPELIGLPKDMRQVAAVSDPANRDPHVFAREWETPSERADTLAKLEALARPRVAMYVSANQLVLGAPLVPPSAQAVGSPSATPSGAAPAEAHSAGGPPKMQRGKPEAYRTPSAPTKATDASAIPTAKAPTTPARAKASAAAKAKAANAPLVLANEELLPYTLSYGGLPTFVYTAQADVRSGGPVYVTLVAQRLVSGDMQVALSSVTDASHLDRTPWLRLVDAVDPDASHRASLVFELRAQTSRQFALYRLTSAQAEQIFVTGAM